jgi:hypothetical protein
VGPGIHEYPFLAVDLQWKPSFATQSRDADHVVAYETVTDLVRDTWLAGCDMFQLQPFTCLWMGEF